MSNGNGHPLLPFARSLRTMHPSRNPVSNPAALSALPANLHPMVAAVAANPALAAAATGADASAGPGTGGSGASFGAAQGQLQPNQAQFGRLPDVRHNVTGSVPVVFAGAGTGKLVFTPQTRFKPNRLIIPSNTLAGTTITNMLVGTRPQYAASSTEPFDMFEEQATSGMWDMDVCEIGQQVAATVAVLGATTVYSCLVGEALDGKPYPMLRSPLKRIATQTAAIAAGASFPVTITPQVRFKTRKLVTDDSTAKYFIITSFNVGISPQLMSGDPVPAAAFTETAQDTWLDCDEAYIGNIITIQVTNIDVAARTFGVALLGDVDPRDLQSAYGYY
jgi:hypothetical protein